MEDKLNQKIFKNKSLSDLFSDIYENSKNKETLIKELIAQLKPMVKEPGDATILVPIIKEYLEIAVKNDEHLIKMASIVQRALQSNPNSSDKELLTEEERKNLLSEVNKIYPN